MHSKGGLKLVLVLALVGASLLMSSSPALAAWWNPRTWFSTGSRNDQMVAPSITPNSGSYNVDFDITISSSELASEVHYTTDGSEPTRQSYPYYDPYDSFASIEVPINVSSHPANTVLTIKAKAFDTNYHKINSTTVTRTYTLNTTDPPPGTTPTVTLKANDSSSDITVNQNSTVKISWKIDNFNTNDNCYRSGYWSGAVTTPEGEEDKTLNEVKQYFYVVTCGSGSSAVIDRIDVTTQTTVQKQLNPPTLTPSVSFTTTTKTITITAPTTTTDGTAVSGTTICYTDNDSTTIQYQSGNCASPAKKYSDPFTIATTTTIRAKAFKTDYTESNVVSATYTKNTNRPPVVSDFKAAKFKDDGTAPDSASFSANPVEVTKGQKVMFTATVTDPDDANTNNGKLHAPELHRSDGTGYQNYTTGVTTVLNGSNANITLDTKDIPDTPDGTNYFKLKVTDKSGDTATNSSFSSNVIEVKVTVKIKYEPFVIKLQSKPETGKSYGIKDSISIKAYQDNILVKEVICEYFCILERLINGEVYTIEILPSLNWQGIKFEYRIGKGEIAPLSGMVELLDKFTARSVNVFLRPSSQNNTGFFSVTTKFAQSDPDRPKYICIQIYHIINNQKVIDKNKCGSTFHVELPSGTYYVGPDPDQHNSLDFIAPVEVQIRTAEKTDYKIILNPIHSKFTLKTTFWEKIDVTPYITDYYEIYIQGRLIEETSKNLVVTDAKDIKTNDDIKIKFQYKGAPFEWTGKITADPIDGNYQEIEIELSPLKCIEKIGNTNLSVPFCYDSDKGVNILSGNDEINNKAVLSISAEIAQLKSNYDETVLEKVYLTDEPADHATAKPKLNLIVITIPEFNGWKLDSQATPSALADTATHEYAHLYDWKMGGNKFYSKYNTDWQKITDSLLYDHKEKYVRDCVYSLPTVVCGELSKGGIKNIGGHPWDNNTEYFASTFSDVDNYEQTYLEKVNIIQYDYTKTLLLKGAELIKSYKK